MDYVEKARELSVEQVACELRKNVELNEKVRHLEHQVQWLYRQFFGPKSERRLLEMAEAGVVQAEMDFGDSIDIEPVPEPEAVKVSGHSRRAKRNPEEDVLEQGLRFSEAVPVEEIEIKPEEFEENPDAFEVIGIRESYRVAARPASYVILKYRRYTVKRKTTGLITTPPAPAAVFERSYADVTLLASLVTDKFLYHLPLYRQHQRLQHAGITLNRSLLTQWVLRVAKLLQPIVDAQVKSILLSKILALDETPLKAGVNKPKRKMKTAWMWPMLGDQDEIWFSVSTGSRRDHLKNILSGFQGTLLSDGNATYRHFVEKTEGIDPAQCWVHTRRYFVRAKEDTPELAEIAMDLIGQLYRLESDIQEKNLTGREKTEYRQQNSKPLVDDFFGWCHSQLIDPQRRPSDPITKAIKYALKRERELRLFLDNPDLPLDTNHLE